MLAYGLKWVQDVHRLPNCSRVPLTNAGVVTRLFGEHSHQRVVCGIFLLNGSIVLQSIWGRVKKHCGCIVLVCSRCTCSSSCHVAFFVASKCLVVFLLVKFTGCFYCSFFVMPIVRRHHKTPWVRVHCFVAC